MKASFKPKKILWMDLEMTGLDPVHDEILEVAAIATDWDFTEIATYFVAAFAPMLTWSSCPLDETIESLAQ